MTQPTRRDELCNNIHRDLQDQIVASRGMMSNVWIPLITECKGDAVAIANYLRGMGYKVSLHEEMKEFLYELNVTWQ